MGVKFNPFIGNLDLVDSPNGEFDSIDLSGDITLDDGGTYTTTVQTVTPTANRTISFPDATGTVALVAGSNGQLTYNSSGAQAGLTSASIGSTDEINISLAGAASTPPVSFTGAWFTGGTSTTTKPQLLIEPTGTTSTAWSTSGTGLGVNAASGFSGRLLDLQTNGTSRMVVQGDGNVGIGITSPGVALHIDGDVRCDGVYGETDTNTSIQFPGSDVITFNEGGTESFRVQSNGNVTIGRNGNHTDATARLAVFNSGASASWTVRPGTNVANQVDILSYNYGTATYLPTRYVGSQWIWFAGSGGERARIDSSGNFGIATTTPEDKLEIGGAGSGIILASPDGTRYRLTVANGGTLSIAAV